MILSIASLGTIGVLLLAIILSASPLQAGAPRIQLPAEPATPTNLDECYNLWERYAPIVKQLWVLHERTHRRYEEAYGQPALRSQLARREKEILDERRRVISLKEQAFRRCTQQVNQYQARMRELTSQRPQQQQQQQRQQQEYARQLQQQLQQQQQAEQPGPRLRRGVFNQSINIIREQHKKAMRDLQEAFRKFDNSFVEEKYRGGRYLGQVNGGTRDGYGKYYFDSGNRYEGEWQDGGRHGFGRFYWQTGERYEGQVRDDEMHGYGKFTDSRGRTHAGYWESGRLVKTIEEARREASEEVLRSGGCSSSGKEDFMSTCDYYTPQDTASSSYLRSEGCKRQWKNKCGG